MSAKRLTKRRAVLERHRAVIIPMMVDGASGADIVAKYGCAASSVTAFQRRHADEIAALQARVTTAVEDVVLKDKEERIRKLAGLYDRMGLGCQCAGDGLGHGGLLRPGFIVGDGAGNEGGPLLGGWRGFRGHGRNPR